MAYGLINTGNDMERKELGLGYFDIARGVWQLVVDEAKLALHAIFDSIHHEAHTSDSTHHPHHTETRTETDHRLASESRKYDYDGVERPLGQ